MNNTPNHSQAPALHAGQSKTVQHYQRRQPDYLNSQFPREVHGWHNFSEADQARMKSWERERLTREGYTEQPDGSWDVATTTKQTSKPVRQAPDAGSIKPVTYTLPAYWASYLINGDGSGLEDGEQAQIDAWINKAQPGYCVDCGEPYFSWRNEANSLGGDVAEYTFLK